MTRPRVCLLTGPPANTSSHFQELQELKKQSVNKFVLLGEMMQIKCGGHVLLKPLVQPARMRSGGDKVWVT